MALGGAVGAVGRYVMMSGIGHWLHAGFPYATLTVNVVGSFVMGAVIEIMALAWSPSQEMRAFIVVGILGSFTTFSTFSLDVFYLFERGNLVQAGMYIALSVLLTITGLYAGMHVFRQVVG